MFQSYLCPGRNKINEINRDYIKTNIERTFMKLLASIGLKTPKKEYSFSNNAIMKIIIIIIIIKHTRYKITLHSLRAFFKTQCSLVAKEFELSEYLLGHNSTIAQRYFRASPEAVAETYKEKVMETVTFFDFESIDRKIKTLEAKTEVINDLQMQINKQADLIHDLTEGQTFANNMSEIYGQEQMIQRLQSQLDEFKRRLDEKDGQRKEKEK